MKTQNLPKVIWPAKFPLFLGKILNSSFMPLMLAFFSLIVSDVALAQNQKSRRTSRAAVAADAQTQGLIKNIEVRGNRRIEKDAIVAKFKSQIGQPYSDLDVRSDIESLFQTGFFYDVKFFREENAGEVTLVCEVVEKPSISEIVFEGNEEVKSEDLLEASGLKTFEILNMSKIRDGVEKIQKSLEDKGYFLARITYKLEPIKETDSVKVIFSIQENEKIKVKKITFLGNSQLKDSTLKGKMITAEGGFFSFISGAGAYKQDAFDRDMQILRLIYFNEGYVQVKIDRPQVYVTPDKTGIYITIRIDEGQQFDVGEIDFAGDILFPRDELTQTIKIDERTIFSYEVLQKDIADLQAKYGDLGYAYANVIPRTRINEADRKVDVTFEFDKGNKVYFGRINIVGNSKTRDKVVRRELRVREGELYNETRRRKSYANIERLGFFEEVNFKTSASPDNPDIMNVDIVVKERNTGTIQLGAGYGSATGWSLNGQVSQSNFLGKGQKLSAGLNLSDDGDYFNISFTEPYFLETEWSIGFDAYQSNNSRSTYEEKKKGGGIRFGHPLGDDIFGSIRYKNEYTQIDPVYGTNRKRERILLTDPTIYPEDTVEGVTSSITLGLDFDQRNDRMSPTDGIYASTSIEYAGVGGDIEYTRGSNSLRYFKKVFWEVVWRNNLNYSFISSHDQESEPPFNELYLLGGPYSVRGYRFGQIGRKVKSEFRKQQLIADGFTEERADKDSEVPFGGKKQLIYQTEFQFPLIAEAGINGVVFYDIGQAEDEITDYNFYSGVGFGFRWFSPIGPLRFEFGFPLDKIKEEQESNIFDFSIGTPF